MHINFGKKKGFTSNGAELIDISGLEILHKETKHVISMQGTVEVNEQIHKQGLPIAIPADPVHIQMLIDDLTLLKHKLTPRHTR